MKRLCGYHVASPYVKYFPLFSCVAKNCMKICIQNMQKISKQVHGLVLAEIAVNVFSFAKDSYPNNPALFEEFENNDGYTVLQAIMARYVSSTSFGEQHSYRATK